MTDTAADKPTRSVVQPPPLWRHAVAIAVFPGTFVVYLPTLLWWLTPQLERWTGLGWLYHGLAWGRPTLLGVAALLAVAGLVRFTVCNVLFHRAGGTLAPQMPPVRLVESGPFATVRNPMILAVFLLQTAIALAAGSVVLVLYVAGFILVKNWYIKHREEPKLLRRHEYYVTYLRRVPRRWLPIPRLWGL